MFSLRFFFFFFGGGGESTVACGELMDIRDLQSSFWENGFRFSEVKKTSEGSSMDRNRQLP